MAGAAVAEELEAALAALVPVPDDVEGEHRRQLFDRQGKVAADAGERRDEGARLGGDLDPRLLGDVGRRLAHDLGVGEALGSDDDPRYRRDLGIAQEVAAVLLHLGDHLVLDRLVADDRLLGRAQRPVIEGLAVEDVLDRLRHVGRPLHVGRDVARSHAEGRLAGGVGRADEADAARGQDDAGVAGPHQLLRSLERYLGQAQERIGGQARPHRGAVHHTHRLQDAVAGRGMGAHHARVAGLDRDERLEDRGGGGIGGGDDRRDHAHRLGDLHHPCLRVFPQDAHRTEGADVVVDVHRREEVLGRLVLRVAEARFLVGEAGQPLGLGARGLGHRFDDPIDLLLGELLEGGGGLLGARGEAPRLLDREEVLVLDGHAFSPGAASPSCCPPPQERGSAAGPSRPPDGDGGSRAPRRARRPGGRRRLRRRWPP